MFEDGQSVVFWESYFLMFRRRNIWMTARKPFTRKRKTKELWNEETMDTVHSFSEWKPYFVKLQTLHVVII